MASLENNVEAADSKIAADAPKIGADISDGDNKLFTEDSGVKTQTENLVGNGVLPNTEVLDFGTGEKAAAVPKGDAPDSINRSADTADHTEPKDGADTGKEVVSEGFRGEIKDPQTFTDIAEAAQGLVEANGDPLKQQKILTDLTDKFGKQNPEARGSTLATYLKTALEVTPGGQNLAVLFNGSEGIRDGNTTIELRDRNNPDAPLATSNHSYLKETSGQELDNVATSIEKDLPSIVSELQSPESLKAIVTAANDLIQAQIKGEPLAPIFEKAAEAYRNQNPNANSMLFSTLMQGAIERNPHSNKALHMSYSSDGESTIFNPTLREGRSPYLNKKQIISRVQIGFASE